jgi:uncharacterized protein (TIGR02118 family)
MAQLVVMYKTPRDAAAFDKHYAEKHIPIAKKIPGVRKYEVSTGPVATPAGPSAYHLIATLTFDNIAAIQNAFGRRRNGRKALAPFRARLRFRRPLLPRRPILRAPMPLCFVPDANLPSRTLDHPAGDLSRGLGLPAILLKPAALPRRPTP